MPKIMHKKISNSSKDISQGQFQNDQAFDKQNDSLECAELKEVNDNIDRQEPKWFDNNNQYVLSPYTPMLLKEDIQSKLKTIDSKYKVNFQRLEISFLKSWQLIERKMRVNLKSKSQNGYFEIYEVHLSYFIAYIKVYRLDRVSRTHKDSDQISFPRLIDEGRFGKVYQAIDPLRASTDLKSEYLSQNAVKEVPLLSKNREGEIQSVIIECSFAKILSALEASPQYTNLFGFDLVVRESSTLFSMECCEAITKAPIFSEKDIDALLSGLSEDLSLLHNLRICHNDIKPSNILYSRRLRKLVFIDFGLTESKLYGMGKMGRETAKGTYQYCSHEMQKLFFQTGSDADNNGEGYVDLYYNDLVCLQNSKDVIKKIFFKICEDRFTIPILKEFSKELKITYDGVIENQDQILQEQLFGPLQPLGSCKKQKELCLKILIPYSIHFNQFLLIQSICASNHLLFQTVVENSLEFYFSIMNSKEFYYTNANECILFILQKCGAQIQQNQKHNYFLKEKKSSIQIQNFHTENDSQNQTQAKIVQPLKENCNIRVSVTQENSVGKIAGNIFSRSGDERLRFMQRLKQIIIAKTPDFIQICLQLFKSFGVYIENLDDKQAQLEQNSKKGIILRIFYSLCLTNLQQFQPIIRIDWLQKTSKRLIKTTPCHEAIQELEKKQFAASDTINCELFFSIEEIQIYNSTITCLDCCLQFKQANFQKSIYENLTRNLLLVCFQVRQRLVRILELIQDRKIPEANIFRAMFQTIFTFILFVCQIMILQLYDEQLSNSQKLFQILNCNFQNSSNVSNSEYIHCIIRNIFRNKKTICYFNIILLNSVQIVVTPHGMYQHFELQERSLQLLNLIYTNSTQLVRSQSVIFVRLLLQNITLILFINKKYQSILSFLNQAKYQLFILNSDETVRMNEAVAILKDKLHCIPKFQRIKKNFIYDQDTSKNQTIKNILKDTFQMNFEKHYEPFCHQQSSYFPTESSAQNSLIQTSFKPDPSEKFSKRNPIASQNKFGFLWNQIVTTVPLIDLNSQPRLIYLFLAFREQNIHHKFFQAFVERIQKYEQAMFLRQQNQIIIYEKEREISQLYDIEFCFPERKNCYLYFIYEQWLYFMITVLMCIRAVSKETVIICYNRFNIFQDRFRKGLSWNQLKQIEENGFFSNKSKQIICRYNSFLWLHETEHRQKHLLNYKIAVQDYIESYRFESKDHPFYLNCLYQVITKKILLKKTSVVQAEHSLLKLMTFDLKNDNHLQLFTFFPNKMKNVVMFLKVSISHYVKDLSTQFPTKPSETPLFLDFLIKVCAFSQMHLNCMIYSKFLVELSQIFEKQILYHMKIHFSHKKLTETEVIANVLRQCICFVEQSALVRGITCASIFTVKLLKVALDLNILTQQTIRSLINKTGRYLKQNSHLSLEFSEEFVRELVILYHAIESIHKEPQIRLFRVLKNQKLLRDSPNSLLYPFYLEKDRFNSLNEVQISIYQKMSATSIAYSSFRKKQSYRSKMDKKFCRKIDRYIKVSID